MDFIIFIILVIFCFAKSFLQLGQNKSTPANAGVPNTMHI